MLRQLLKVLLLSFIGGVVVGLVSAMVGYPVTPDLIVQGLAYVFM